MASSAARKEAQSMLGSFNTSGYKDQRKVAKSIYDTSITDAGNQWTNLQNQLNIQRKASASDFNQGRANIGEVQYLADRAERNRRLAGGTSSSGYDALSNVSNRMALNKQQSDVANTYYDALEGIQTSENIGKQTYDTALKSARDMLDNSLANINLAQQQGKNSYNQALAGLAEQIQSRWDAQAAAASAQNLAKEQLKYNIDADKAKRMNEVLSVLSKNPDTLELTRAYNALAAIGFDDAFIQNTLNNSVGIDYTYKNGVPVFKQPSTNVSLPTYPTYNAQNILPNIYENRRQELQDRLSGR